ncbi:IS1/IS1595 family N-terminal zinc-binding domain-containing protein [Clostridium sp.]|uniref:IS1/IS1595 family N-terminal zinc-binding domain-containing protein n=1 Tax=Clostridium sp. TaxID=1506 RepID=UPI002FC6C14E
MNNYKQCPFCLSESFIKYGHYKKIQRYQCKDCNKTFSESTNSIWFNSKKQSKVWYDYCFLMFSGNSIRACASQLHISINTSFKWRHKILNKLPNCNNNIFLYNYVGLKHMQFIESFKGQKVPPVTLIAEPRRKVFLSVAINENCVSFSKIISKGMLYQPLSYKLLKEKVKFNSNIIGYYDRYAPAIAKQLNNELKNFRECPPLKKINLKDFLYSFSSLLKIWLGIFRGVATKYLDAYLDWFIHVFEDSFKSKVMTSNIINAIFCS